MKVWAVANQKGGVGKTTTTVTLGGLLAAWGFRTLMIDIDPHGSLSSYFGYDPDNIEQSSYDLFMAAGEKRHLDPRTLVQETGTDGLDLIPAALALASLDRQSGRLEGLGLALKKAVQQFEGEYDYVLIDCPPILGILLINALAACQQLLIPVQTDFLAMKGLERMLNTLKMVNKARHEPLEYAIIPTYYDSRTRASKDTLSQMRRDYHQHLWHGYIPIDTKLRDASRAGIPPAIYDPRSRAVMAYTDLLETLQRDPSLTQGRSEASV
jgi:chromosome partitioning protein